MPFVLLFNGTPDGFPHIFRREPPSAPHFVESATIRFLRTAAQIGTFALVSSVTATAVTVKKNPAAGTARQVGEQHLHAALRHTHAAAKEEKAGNGKAALAEAQSALKELHSAAHAFDLQYEASGSTAPHHHTHPHIHAAIKDLQAAEKMIAAGHVEKSEKDFHKAATQINDAIKAHQLHHKKEVD